MIVHLDQIPVMGFQVPELGDWAAAAVGLVLEGHAERVDGELLLVAYGDEIRVTGYIAAVVRRPCDRCAVDLVVELEGDVDLHYVPAGSREGEECGALHGSELEIGFYADGAIDLASVVGEYFALGAPARLACDVPGARVADGESCGALKEGVEAKKPVDPRFAALAGLKLDD